MEPSAARHTARRTKRITAAMVIVVLGLALVACRVGPGTSSPSGGPTSSGIELRGSVTAGPVCPVERNPPDPSCAPRPVASATIVVQDAGGHEVARMVSDAEGRFAVVLDPGSYTLVPQPAAGLFRAAQVDVEIVAGVPSDVINIVYDTGIR